MLVCSNVNFLTFWDSHLIRWLGIPLRLAISIKCLEGGGFLYATGNPWSFNGKGRLGVAGSQTLRIVE